MSKHDLPDEEWESNMIKRTRKSLAKEGYLEELVGPLNLQRPLIQLLWLVFPSDLMVS